MHHIQRFALVLTLALAACADFPRSTTSSEAGIDGVACIGDIKAAPGLSEVSNASLLVKAQGRSGKGGTCAAKVFSVTSPLVLYRVYDAANPRSKFGSWWALEAPSGSREDYRALNAICKEWSSLDRLISCEVRPGSEVVLGTTQSATCADGSTYNKTPAIQVFVPNDAKVGILHVGACREDAIWQ
jgi:hypothetical protein